MTSWVAYSIRSPACLLYLACSEFLCALGCLPVADHELESSPLSMFIATLTLFLWRPIMVELGSALPISGAPYTYLYVPSKIISINILIRAHVF